MTEKILIVGMGFLGKTIYTNSQKLGITVEGTYHNRDPQLDICDSKSIENVILSLKPSIIYNCVALTNLDEIEKNPQRAYDVNAYGAKNLAEMALKHKIKLVQLSTDGVFDGTKGMYSEDDLPNPINEYSKSKKLGEEFVSNTLKNYIIVRTNFYGLHENGKFLFNWIIKNLKTNHEIVGFDDVIFNPLEVNNLSQMLLQLKNTNFKGILHLSSDQVMSKYQFAKKIASILDYDSNLIRRGSIQDLKFIAKRPLNTSLSNHKARKILKTKPISLEKWLREEFI